MVQEPLNALMLNLLISGVVYFFVCVNLCHSLARNCVSSFFISEAGKLHWLIFRAYFLEKRRLHCYRKAFKVVGEYFILMR